MKQIVRNPHNLAYLFLLIITLWSLVAFFTYHIVPLPERMPEAFIATLDRELRPGEPVFLTDQRYDAFVWNHPQYNIFPGGGRHGAQASAQGRFFVVGSSDLPGEFSALKKEFSITAVAREDGMALWRFVRREGAPAEFRLSDSFPADITVRSSVFPDGASFENGEFTVGHATWEKVQVKSGEFGGERRSALSVHPLNGDDQWIELTVDPAPWHAEALAFGDGGAAAGDCKGSCPPAKIVVTQGERSVSFESADNRWQRSDLAGFDATRPLTIRVSVSKAGRRHFFCDLFFIVPPAKEESL